MRRSCFMHAHAISDSTIMHQCMRHSHAGLEDARGAQSCDSIVRSEQAATLHATTWSLEGRP